MKRQNLEEKCNAGNLSDNYGNLSTIYTQRTIMAAALLRHQVKAMTPKQRLLNDLERWLTYFLTEEIASSADSTEMEAAIKGFLQEKASKYDAQGIGKIVRAARQSRQPLLGVSKIDGPG